MKKYFWTLLIFCVICAGNAAGFAVTSKTLAPIPDISAVPSAVQPQSVDFVFCSKSFKLNNERLFYITLSAINANRFTIVEIQSNSGYIIFSIKGKEFLASIIELDSFNSMLKITPCDNVYIFPIGIVQNMFKYIELNTALQIENLPVIR